MEECSISSVRPASYNWFGNDNSRAYEAFLEIEVLLREHASTCLSEDLGPKWQKQLPGELLKKVRASQKDEIQPYYEYRILGPLYYLTFGELLAIYRWKLALRAKETIGGERFIAELEGLCGIRNALSHSRPLPKDGESSLQLAKRKIRVAIGDGQADTYLQNPSVGISCADGMKCIEQWLEEIKPHFNQFFADTQIPVAYTKIASQYWWGDTELAGFDTNLIDNLMDLAKGYNSIGRGVGSLDERRRYVVDHEIIDKIDHIQLQLSTLKK